MSLELPPLPRLKAREFTKTGWSSMSRTSVSLIDDEETLAYVTSLGGSPHLHGRSSPYERKPDLVKRQNNTVTRGRAAAKPPQFVVVRVDHYHARVVSILTGKAVTSIRTIPEAMEAAKTMQRVMESMGAVTA